jgi:hypothetical protein
VSTAPVEPATVNCFSAPRYYQKYLFCQIAPSRAFSKMAERIDPKKARKKDPNFAGCRRWGTPIRRAAVAAATSFFRSVFGFYTVPDLFYISTSRPPGHSNTDIFLLYHRSNFLQPPQKPFPPCQVSFSLISGRVMPSLQTCGVLCAACASYECVQCTRDIYDECVC